MRQTREDLVKENDRLSKQNTLYALYMHDTQILDESGEAFDVLYFCSDACRDDAAAATEKTNIALGSSSDAIDGTQCENCGKEVQS